VTNMDRMFYNATSFNSDLSKWDVSSVTNMDNMFKGAASFTRTLCGDSWRNSKADKTGIKIGTTNDECPVTTQKGGIDNMEPWVIPAFSAIVLASLVILLLAVLLGVFACVKTPSGHQDGSKTVPTIDTENPVKQDAGDDDDDESPGLSQRMRRKSDVELQEIINKDSAAVERYNSLVKEGKEAEYKSDLSVKELEELIEDVGL